MSRTFKDAPGARKSRRERLADREIPFERQPADTAHAWESFADPGLSSEARLAAAAFLGLDTAVPPTAAELAAAHAQDEPDQWWPTQAAGDVQVRAEWTQFANGF
jgi:hypothetical protein